jgi:hypothetical protein
MGAGNSIGEDSYKIKLKASKKLGEGSFAQVYKIIRKKDGL